jgi:ATP-dependent helicase HrpB
MCASLSEGRPGQPAFHLQHVTTELQRIGIAALDGPPAVHATDMEIRHALFTGYADRLAKRRAGARDRFVLATGHGATLARDVDVGGAEYLVALDVIGGGRAGVSEATIRAASAVGREWIEPTSIDVEHRLDPGSGRVRAVRLERYDAIVLTETPITADPAIATMLLRDAWLARSHDATTTQLLRRLRFAVLDVDLDALVAQAAGSARSVEEIDLEAHLPFEVKRALAISAPASIAVPSGRNMRLEYAEDGSVSASVKLQELFGLAESPTLGPARVPVTFHLLAPNGRPVQTTRDLRSFWERTYPEVRKELRGRYPKHPWPDDPWTATPTHRTQKRRQERV